VTDFTFAPLLWGAVLLAVLTFVCGLLIGWLAL
jgi:hypothetical protein